jgi:hypothetical protein
MDIKHYIATIIAHHPDEMSTLEDLFEDAFEAASPHVQKHIYHKLHRLAYGPHLSRQMADEWTAHMHNKDGSSGPHWSYDQTSQHAEERNKEDFYAVLNMMYSDYFSPSFTQQQYITLARDFIDDKDGPEDKTLKYYCEIAKKW